MVKRYLLKDTCKRDNVKGEKDRAPNKFRGRKEKVSGGHWAV